MELPVALVAHVIVRRGAHLKDTVPNMSHVLNDDVDTDEGASHLCAYRRLC